MFLILNVFAVIIRFLEVISCPNALWFYINFWKDLRSMCFRFCVACTQFPVPVNIALLMSACRSSLLYFQWNRDFDHELYDLIGAYV